MDWDLLVASDLELGIGALPVVVVAPPSKRSCLRAPGGVVSFGGGVLQGVALSTVAYSRDGDSRSAGTRRRGRTAWAGD